MLTLNRTFQFLLLAGISLTSTLVRAEDEKTLWEKTKEKTSQAVDYVQDKSKLAYEKTMALGNESIQKRNSIDYAFLAHYSYLDLVIPGKYGLTFSMNSADRTAQYEIQYLRGSVSVPFVIQDLGSMTEQRLSFLKRNFSSTSNFNWFYGISYNKFDIELGPKYLGSLAPGQNIANYKLMNIETLGFDLGLGHRWYYKNGFTIAVDWAAISQPLALLKREAPYTEASNTSQDNQDNADKALKVISYFPRFSFLKFTLGYSF